MKSSLSELAASLRAAKTPYIYGLRGISMEEQRAAVALARSCGAVISVPRVFQPTLTKASLAAFDLVLTAGGDPGDDIAFEGTAVRDDRLFEAESWRGLSSLYRGTPIPGADTYLDLKALLDQHERAVLILQNRSLEIRARRALTRFASELYDLSVLEIPALPNALGAFEVMLEECGDAAAWFRDSRPLTGDALAGLSGCCDLLLRIGEADEVPEGEAPCYALSEDAQPGVRHVRAASKGGTYLRFDGVPVAVTGTDDGPALLDQLRALIEEVTA